MATIKIRQNGPYLVEGDDVTLVDWNGAPYQIRSGHSRCAGAAHPRPSRSATARTRGSVFQAAEAAVKGSEDKPAQ